MTTNTYEFKREVEQHLLSLPHAHRISNNQIALRCMFCGDSKKDPSKTRFYVQPNIDKDAPMLYTCFNCGVSGVLTPSVLRTFEINDLELNTKLISYNKDVSKKMKKMFNTKQNKIIFSAPKPKNTLNNLNKKKYIESRLGRSFTVDELISLKTIFSLEQFLSENDIDNVNCKKERALRLNSDYVGFLSVGNELIIYRDITNKNKLRYDKYTIIPELDNTRKFYTIPNSIDLFTSDTININLAEGVFDVLGIYYHIKNEKRENEIYAAVCDSSYANVVKYFISLGLAGDNIIVNIYSDSDHEPYFYNRIIKELSPWVKKINLLYNELGKDYGVPKDQISVIKRHK